jgi:KaiC/GvpD/RAD55 family RecA-like ATPase
MNCFPFLSRQIGGLLPGTFTMLGGFSSTGKSTWFITIIMALLHYDRKVLIITNEEDVKRFKIKFLVWMLGKYTRYFKLTKKKMTSGQIDAEDKKYLKEVQEFWKENYSNRVKIISVADADMSVVKKKIRENVLRHGYDTVLYDTFKIQEEDMTKNRSDLALVKHSRDLHKLAKKYNIIMLATVQLSEYTKGKLFLDASVSSNCKALKEICENLLMLRNVYEEEKDPKSKHYCRPYKLKKVNDKWVEEQCELDSNATYKMLFVEKCRAGANSSDTGSAYILRFAGDHCVFREQFQCKPRHGQIT